MAGYWPSSSFACLWTKMTSKFINSQKKNEANTNKLGKSKIYHMAFWEILIADTADTPERARWLHLAHLLRITVQSGVAMTDHSSRRLD